MGNFTNLKGKQNHLELQRWAPEWWMDELTNLVPCWIWSHGPRNPGPLPWLTKIRVAIAVACGAVWLSHMTLSGWLSLTQIIGMKCLNISFSHIISSTWPIFKQLCFKVSVSWRDMGLVVPTCSKSLGEIGLSNNRFLFRGNLKRIPRYTEHGELFTTTNEHSMISMGPWTVTCCPHGLCWSQPRQKTAVLDGSNGSSWQRPLPSLRHVGQPFCSGNCMKVRNHRTTHVSCLPVG